MCQNILEKIIHAFDKKLKKLKVQIKKRSKCSFGKSSLNLFKKCINFINRNT